MLFFDESLCYWKPKKNPHQRTSAGHSRGRCANYLEIASAGQASMASSTHVAVLPASFTIAFPLSFISNIGAGFNTGFAPHAGIFVNFDGHLVLREFL